MDMGLSELLSMGRADQWLDMVVYSRREEAEVVMRWRESHRADKRALELADRHYNRQKPGSPQYVPPGACVCLWMPGAVWTTSWPLAEYVKHAWPGAWVNSLFRNEGAGLSSELIMEAVAATRWYWQPPEIGIVTFVNPDKVRHKRDPGRCYKKAGWKRVADTAAGLWTYQLLPDAMPLAEQPLDVTGDLF